MIATINLTLAQAGEDTGRPVLPEADQAQQQGQQQNGQGQQQPGESQNGQPNPQPVSDDTGGGWLGGALPLVLLLVLLLMFIFMSTSQRRERKKHQAMLDALSKGDKVQTVGGIIGTVVDMREDEVMVKVDENANTRLRFARSAIKNVIESKGGAKE